MPFVSRENNCIINLVNKYIDLYVLNALILTSVFNSKIFPGVISQPGPSLKGGGGRRGKERKSEGLHHGCWGVNAPVRHFSLSAYKTVSSTNISSPCFASVSAGLISQTLDHGSWT